MTTYLDSRPALDVRADAVTDFINGIVPSLGPFTGLQTLGLLIAGLVYFVAIGYCVILIISGLPSVFGQDRRNNAGRERFEKGGVGFLLLAVALPVIVLVYTQVTAAF